MVYILMQQPDMIKRMYFEHGYCFNCWYRNMDDPRIDHPAFTVHFAGALRLAVLRARAHASAISSCCGQSRAGRCWLQQRPAPAGQPRPGRNAYPATVC